MDYLALIENHHPLTLQLDDEIYQYLKKTEPEVDEDGEPIPFSFSVSLVIKYELRDRANQHLRSNVAASRIGLFDLRNDLINVIKNASDRFPAETQEQVIRLLEENMGHNKPEPDRRSTLVDTLGSPPPRSPRLNANVPRHGQKMHEVRTYVDGACHHDLVSEADKASIHPEELAVQVLHNYKETENIREEAGNITGLDVDLYLLRCDVVAIAKELLKLIDEK